MNRYSTNISWSDEDGSYIATCPEFPGLSAFGETPEEALAEAHIALQLFIDTYNEDGVPLPEPQVARNNMGKFRIPSSKPATPDSIDRGSPEGRS
jgi:predicted RNase H-like HicB family nuclease